MTRRAALLGLTAASTSLIVAPVEAALAPSHGLTQPKSHGPITKAMLNIQEDTAGAIPPYFAGFSYEKNALSEPLFQDSNHDLIGLFRRLGPGMLRIGGNSVERNVWTAEGTGQTPGRIARADIERLAGFVKAANWQCLYGVNLEGIAHGTTSPELAADEVAFAAEHLGKSLAGIEIGNECDLYGRAQSALA